jgi:hypothetical protein
MERSSKKSLSKVYTREGINLSFNSKKKHLISLLCPSSDMQHNGFTLNGEKDPAKRKAKLRERIKHLEESKEVLEDQIDIMKEEIRSLEVKEYIESLENKQGPRAFLDVI